MEPSHAAAPYTSSILSAASSATSFYLLPVEVNKPKEDICMYPPMEFFNFVNKCIEPFKNENNILKQIVKNQWKTIQYDKEYSAYLLGQHSDEEFYKIAEQFAVEPLWDIDDQTFFKWIKVVFTALDERLTSSDLSIITNFDCSFIESKLTNTSIEEID